MPKDFIFLSTHVALCTVKLLTEHCSETKDKIICYLPLWLLMSTPDSDIMECCNLPSAEIPQACKQWVNNMINLTLNWLRKN